MNRNLIILLVVLVVLLVATVSAIFLLKPSSPEVPLPSPSPMVTDIPSYDPDGIDPNADDPLAGLTEEEIAALAMGEEDQQDFGSGFEDVADGAMPAPID